VTPHTTLRLSLIPLFSLNPEIATHHNTHCIFYCAIIFVTGTMTFKIECLHDLTSITLTKKRYFPLTYYYVTLRFRYRLPTKQWQHNMPPHIAHHAQAFNFRQHNSVVPPKNSDTPNYHLILHPRLYKTRINRVITVQTVTLFTAVAMVTTHICSQCFSVMHNSDFCNHSVAAHRPTVGPTSELPSSAQLLLVVVGYSKVTFRGSS
jgi:hypothetical protein